MTRRVESAALELARDRAANVSQLRYNLALAIPHPLSRPVTASTVMRFRPCGRLQVPQGMLAAGMNPLRDHADPRRCAVEVLQVRPWSET